MSIREQHLKNSLINVHYTLFFDRFSEMIFSELYSSKIFLISLVVFLIVLQSESFLVYPLEKTPLRNNRECYQYFVAGKLQRHLILH